MVWPEYQHSFSLSDTRICTYDQANSVLKCELDLLVAWPEYQDSFSLTDTLIYTDDQANSVLKCELDLLVATMICLALTCLVLLAYSEISGLES